APHPERSEGPSWSVPELGQPGPSLRSGWGTPAVPALSPCRPVALSSSIALTLARPPRSPPHPARQLARRLAIGDHGTACHHAPAPARAQPVRLGEGGPAPHRGGSEHYDIGPHADFEHASVAQAHPLGGEGAELADGVFQGEQALLAHVLPENAGEG